MSIPTPQDPTQSGGAVVEYDSITPQDHEDFRGVIHSGNLHQAAVTYILRLLLNPALSDGATSAPPDSGGEPSSKRPRANVLPTQSDTEVSTRAPSEDSFSSSTCVTPSGTASPYDAGHVPPATNFLPATPDSTSGYKRSPSRSPQLPPLPAPSHALIAQSPEPSPSMALSLAEVVQACAEGNRVGTKRPASALAEPITATAASSICPIPAATSAPTFQLQYPTDDGGGEGDIDKGIASQNVANALGALHANGPWTLTALAALLGHPGWDGATSAFLWQPILASVLRSGMAAALHPSQEQTIPNVALGAAPDALQPSSPFPGPALDPVAAALCGMLEDCGGTTFAAKPAVGSEPLVIVRPPLPGAPVAATPGPSVPSATAVLPQASPAAAMLTHLAKEALRKVNPGAARSALLAARKRHQQQILSNLVAQLPQQPQITPAVAPAPQTNHSSGTAAKLPRLGRLTANSTERVQLPGDLTARVRRRLAETEGAFTLKSAVYQNELRALTIGMQAHEFVGALQDCPDAPLSKWDHLVLGRIVAVAKAKGWEELIEHDRENRNRLDDLLTSIVNKILMLVVVEHQSWYLHAVARTQVAATVGRMVDAAAFNCSKGGSSKFRDHVISFVEARVRNFRDAIARHVKQRAKRDAATAMLSG